VGCGCNLGRLKPEIEACSWNETGEMEGSRGIWNARCIMQDRGGGPFDTVLYCSILPFFRNGHAISPFWLYDETRRLFFFSHSSELREAGDVREISAVRKVCKMLVRSI
jgi:hypothetical protein